MPYFQYPDEFPLSSLPPLIRDAVIEAQQITQAPWGLWQHLPGRCFTCLPESD